jgi:molybdopterin-containing oxidoreductase family iron-sulfur binding subunit
LNRDVDDSRNSSLDEPEPLVELRLGRDAPMPVAEPSRRDFLSLVGFSLGAAGIAGCRAPTQRAGPLLTASSEMVPGVPNWYATTCGGCPSACSLLVKQRDGRPIKIEGNEASALFGGGTCATGQATVLSLYDGERLRGPTWRGEPISWKEVDERVAASLEAAHRLQRRIVLLSGTLVSPSTRAIVAQYAAKFPTFRHVAYDAVSYHAIRAATAASFGRAVIPHYSFSRARVIVALEADFLGTWLSPVEFARQYANARRASVPGSTHVQIESGLSVTGSNADARIRVAPSELGAVAAALFARVARRAGWENVPETVDPIDPSRLDALVEVLWQHRGESLVVSGTNDTPLQIVVHAINAALGNVGRTLDLARPSLQRQGDDLAMESLLDDLNRGEVHTLLLYGANPAYDHPRARELLRGLERVELAVSFADRRDETSSVVHAICPDHHFLESWGDAEPVSFHFGLQQPTVAPLFDTRAAPESLLRFIGQGTGHHSFLRAFWRDRIFPRQRDFETFDAFWDYALERGVVDLGKTEAAAPTFAADWRGAVVSLVEAWRRARELRAEGAIELHLHESVALRDGSQANNPWLLELPDPITKVTWGNVAAISPELAARAGVTSGDVVSLAVGLATIELPVFVQPGQDAGTISVAVGYGRTHVGKAGRNVGVNVYPFVSLVRGERRHAQGRVTMSKTGRREELAATQSHFSMEGRPIAEESFEEEPTAEHEPLSSLWAERPKGDHAWGMAIDLGACIGCSACVVACQAENNVPVVGKTEVAKNRSMHWIRIDHYLVGPEDAPRSMHQPMMCQHCQHAPCETVCPVLATTTSSEGLNQQVYNRCIGTRYCANNCPYKVRRFNWFDFGDKARFDFNMANPLGRMVLNPDVTVRSRGVMEKCSLCVQRIQYGKNAALKNKTDLVDGDIHTACEQACPTQAIVFGDLRDPKSRVSVLSRDARAYRVLDELGTRPNVSYLKKVRHARGV